MKQAVQDAFEKELDNREEIKSVTSAYVNKSKCSIQECVYRILEGQWLRKTSSSVIFAISNVPENALEYVWSKIKSLNYQKTQERYLRKTLWNYMYNAPVQQVMVLSLAFFIPFVLLSFRIVLFAIKS